MSHTITTPSKIQPTARLAAELADCIDDVGRAVRALEIAIDELDSAIDSLNDSDPPAAVIAVAEEMSRALADVRAEFDCANFVDQLLELEELADEDDEADEADED